MKRLLYAEKTFSCHGRLINQLSDPKYAITAWALRVIIFILLHSAKEQLPKVKWFGQSDGERERQGGRWKGERWRKKEVKQERQCEVGERKEEREREMTCIGSEKRVQNDHISVTGKLLSRSGECVNDLPLDTHIHTCTHTDLAQSWGKKWRKKKKLELRCEIKGDLLHLSVINHHVITRVHRSLSLSPLSASSLRLSSFSTFIPSVVLSFLPPFVSSLSFNLLQSAHFSLDVSISGAEV